MAIIRYDRGLGRRVTPSQTNVVRTTTPRPTGPIQGPALNPVTGRADYAQNVVSQPRVTSIFTGPAVSIDSELSKESPCRRRTALIRATSSAFEYGFVT